MRFRVALIFLFFVEVSFAQSFFVISNEDFGVRASLFLDSQEYQRDSVDREQMCIYYDCTLALLEHAPEASPVVMQVGNIRQELKAKENPNMFIKGQYVLQIGRKLSKYVSISRYQSDSTFAAGGSAFHAGAFFRERANPIFAQDCYYQTISERKLVFTGRLAADDFTYEEQLPEIQWRLEGRDSVICGQVCHFATGIFRGRQYNAWYTDNIASPVGPWKLSGLPGAILQIEDVEKSIKICATKIMAGKSNILMTRYPYIKVSRKQYAQLQEQMRKSPAVFTASHLSRSSFSVNVGLENEIKSYPKYVLLENDLIR